MHQEQRDVQNTDFCTNGEGNFQMTAKLPFSAIVTVVFLFFSAVATANCFDNGQSYPVGAVVNGKVCTPQGWRPL